MKNAQTNVQKIKALGYQINTIGGYYFAIKGNKGIKSSSLDRIYQFLTKQN